MDKKPEKSQVFLKSIAKLLPYLTLESKTKRVLELGCGKGIISHFLAEHFSYFKGIEIDEKFSSLLKTVNVNFSDFTTYEKQEAFDLFVSNLPFKNYLQFLFKTLKEHPEIEYYYIIVQAEVGNEILSGKRRINKIIGHHFESTFLCKIGRLQYEPIPKVDTIFLKLKKIRCYDDRIEKLKTIRQGKKIAKFGKSFYALTKREFEELLDSL